MTNEIIKEESISPSEDEAAIVVSLTDLAESHAESVQNLTSEIKKTSQMLQDGFLNDVVYREHQKTYKEVREILAQTKFQIMKQPQNVLLSDKLKSMKQEKKEKQASLSDYLLELERMGGVNQLELFDGQVFEIVKTAKLIKKR